MHLLTPAPMAMAEAELLERVRALEHGGRAPFDERAIALLDRIAGRLLAETAPQLTALGFWLRRSATTRLAERFAAALPGDCVAAPRGVALHLPPANVDTLFAYSWALSVLAGNCNVVRLPALLDDTARRLLAHILAAVDTAGEADRHLFVTYPSDGGGTASFSRLADLRLVWGGDTKIGRVSCLPLRPGGVSLDFPDRFSYAAIAAPAYGPLDDSGRDQLAAAFCNDLLWFDQAACASPHLLYWVGGEDGRADFLTRVQAEALRRGWRPDPSARVARFALANELAAEGPARLLSGLAEPLLAVETQADLRGRASGGGMLAVRDVAALEEIPVERRDQTLAVFGFAPETLRAFARAAGPRGLARIVPVGEALSFDSVWDGFDLVQSMSRRVVVR